MYVGSTKSIKTRKYEHFRSLSKGTHHSPYLQKSYDKYGKDKFAFYVLEECTPEDRKQKELYYITLYKTFDRAFGYNVFEPNEDKFECSKETKLKILEARKQEGNTIPVDAYDIQGNFLGTFESAQSCSKNFGFHKTIVSDILKGKRKSFKGMTFVKSGEKLTYKSSPKQRDMSKFHK